LISFSGILARYLQSIAQIQKIFLCRNELIRVYGVWSRKNIVRLDWNAARVQGSGPFYSNKGLS
jgi:hypothetical protein